MFALTLILCDTATIVDDKLSIGGGGWNTCPASLTAHALALVVESPAEYGGATITLGVTLTEETGDPITVITGQGAGPFAIAQPLPVAPAVHDQVPIATPIAITMGSIELHAGQVYHWVVTIEEDPAARWVRTFYVHD